MTIQSVFRGTVLALTFAASAANGDALWQDLPAWAKGGFSGRAEGWVSSTGQEETVWVDENPKARVSVKMSDSGVMSGEMKIGERTFTVSTGGIVTPEAEEDGFIDFVELSEPSVALLNGAPATEVEFEMENMSDDYEWCHDGENYEAPRARIWMRFFCGEDEYEVELFRDFTESEIPEKIKALKGAWVYDGENTNKWTLAVDGLGSATLKGITDDGFEFETQSKIIDYGDDYFGECGAYFNVPATKDHEGVDVWIGFNPEDHSADSVDGYQAIPDDLTIMNDEESKVDEKDEDKDGKMEFIVQPSAEKTEVEVTIPQNVNPHQVTVRVTPNLWVKANGANVQVVNGPYDITGLIDIPPSDEEGWINLAQAMVKEEYVKETLDAEKGAEINLDPENPILITAPTQYGLIYTFSEGATLESMQPDASKVGDGQSWTPEIKVKGGKSAFYSISVGK